MISSTCCRKILGGTTNSSTRIRSSSSIGWRSGGDVSGTTLKCTACVSRIQRLQHQYRTKSSTIIPPSQQEDDDESNNNNNERLDEVQYDNNNDIMMISPETVKWKYHRHLLKSNQSNIKLSPRRFVPSNIIKPLYATTGDTISSPPSHSTTSQLLLNNIQSSSSSIIPRYHLPDDEIFINHMRNAGQIAATTLRLACDYAQRLEPKNPSSSSSSVLMDGIDDRNHQYQRNMKTTDDIDALVHDTIIHQYNAYPSPLNYATFPKSVCTSINEIICHGIPECTRELYYGDIISIDVSCYTKNRVHGDNCATIIVGDYNDDDDTIDPTVISSSSSSSSSYPPPDPSILVTPQKAHCDWRNVPYRTQFATLTCRDHFYEARRLMIATRMALMSSISMIRPNITYLSDIGRVCQNIAHQYGYTSVSKYRGHGIGTEFHCPPFVKHYYNENDYDNEEEPILIRDGMIFTIEPMLCQYDSNCSEWTSDHWTVTTLDNGLSAQFEHTIYVTKTGVEILTLPFGHPYIGRDYIF